MNVTHDNHQSWIKIKLMMVLKHEMIISKEEKQFRVTIGYKYRIESGITKKAPRFNRDKTIPPITHPPQHPSVLLPPQFSQPPTHILTLLTLPVCLGSSSPTPALARLISSKLQRVFPILAFPAGVQTLLLISGWGKAVKAQ